MKSWLKLSDSGVANNFMPIIRSGEISWLQVEVCLSLQGRNQFGERKTQKPFQDLAAVTSEPDLSWLSPKLLSYAGPVCQGSLSHEPQSQRQQGTRQPCLIACNRLQEVPVDVVALRSLLRYIALHLSSFLLNSRTRIKVPGKEGATQIDM